MNDEMRRIRFTGFSEMRFVTLPFDVTFDTVTRFRIMGRRNTFRGGGQGFLVTPTRCWIVGIIVMILLLPHLFQDAHSFQSCEFNRCISLLRHA